MTARVYVNLLEGTIQSSSFKSPLRPVWMAHGGAFQNLLGIREPKSRVVSTYFKKEFQIDSSSVIEINKQLYSTTKILMFFFFNLSWNPKLILFSLMIHWDFNHISGHPEVARSAPGPNKLHLPASPGAAMLLRNLGWTWEKSEKKTIGIGAGDI